MDEAKVLEKIFLFALAVAAGFFVIWRLWGQKMSRWLHSVHRPSPTVMFSLYGAFIGACLGFFFGSQGVDNSSVGFVLFFGLCGAMVGAAYGSKQKWKS